MKTISQASVLLLAFAILLGSTPTTEGLDLGLGLGPIIGGLTNLTNPVLGPVLGPVLNLTAPILGSPPVNSSIGLNLTNVVGGVTNLTSIVGPINNLTNGVVAGLNPLLTNVTGGVTGALNLTNIVGSLNNITGPLINALTNLTGPASNLSLSTNVTVTVSLNIPPAVKNANIVTSFPNSLTISPLGLTEVAFSVYTVQGSNMTAIPVTITVPVLTYLNLPISGSAQITVDFPLGSTLAVVGITNTISRLFFGVSWQTFPQLSSVVISQLLPGSSHSDPLYVLDIPALLCKPFNSFATFSSFVLWVGLCLTPLLGSVT